MLVTVIRSYSSDVVELPDGLLLRPFKFVEYTDLPDSMKDGVDGKPSALQKLVDARLVKVAQIQDIGHLMTQGTTENRLSGDVTGQYVPAAGATSPEELKRIAERDAQKPANVTENSRVSILSADEASRSAEFRTPVDELTASKVSIAQKATGAEDDGKSEVSLVETAQTGEGVQTGAAS